MSVEGITGQKSLSQIMAEAKTKFLVAKVDYDLFFLAHKCHCKLSEKIFGDDKMRDVTADSINIRVDHGHMFFESLSKVHAGCKRKLFDTYLENFGLVVNDGRNGIKKYTSNPNTENKITYYFVFSVQMK